jgi:hypothetical protein
MLRTIGSSRTKHLGSARADVISSIETDAGGDGRFRPDKRSFLADRADGSRSDQPTKRSCPRVSQKRQALVTPDSDSLDASNLIMPMVFFMAPTSAHVEPLHAINRS